MDENLYKLVPVDDEINKKIKDLEELVNVFYLS